MFLHHQFFRMTKSLLGQNFLIEKSQLTNMSGIIELENHHFATHETMDVGNTRQ